MGAFGEIAVLGAYGAIAGVSVAVALGGGDGRVQPLVGDRLAFLDAKGAHDPVEALAGEDA